MSKYIYFLMAFLLINITLVRDLKLNKIGLKYFTSSMASKNNSITSDQNRANFFGDEFSETGEEEEGEEEGEEEENDLEDDDLFFSSYSGSVNTFLVFNFKFNYFLFLSKANLGITTPPPRTV